MGLGRRVAGLAASGALLVPAALLSAALAACSSGTSPQDVAQAYLTAWASRDWSTMRALVASPPANFTSVNAAALTELSASGVSFDPGHLTVAGGSASEPVTEHIAIAEIGRAHV